jgi:hexosaminidase
MTRNVSILLLTAVLVGCGPGEEALDTERYPLVPIPAEVEAGKGQFQLSQGTPIVVSHLKDAELVATVERWAEPIRQASGLALPIVGAGEVRGRGAIHIEWKPEESFWEEALWQGGGTSSTAQEEVPAGMGLPGPAAEAYELEVRPGKIELEARGKAGIFYGLGTLSQLLPGLRGDAPGAAAQEAASAPAPQGARAAAAAAEASADAQNPWAIPAVEIEDTPRFPYRGMHLDVGRHYFPVDFIRGYIDLLATYRMNVFHWHLTEDQGWRLEILGYPRLTEVGSCRAETILEKNFRPYVGDGIEYCGYYTQDEAREIVEYARERFITVIPEIEMPGHSVAALAAYPEFACTPGPFQVATRWGVMRDIYCPREETFGFLEDVLTEVMEIFPSPYIHIGGDEAPKTAWEQSAFAQEVIEREGLADEEELQSWFIRRIETFLNQNGRRLIGWDEILEGGLAPDATVMSWRGMQGGIAAAREGHDVVMTPTSHVYFDYYQGDTLQEPLAIAGFTPLEKVYDFEPVPPELTPLEARHVLGAQGNVWTEYMKTTDYVEYMVLPRLLALSEVVWSPAETRDWGGFTNRIPTHLTRLSVHGYNFRVPDVLGLEHDGLTLGDAATVELSAPVEGGTIVYTLDGSDPDLSSPRYAGPFPVGVDEGGIVVSARVLMDDGRAGAVRRARFSKTALAPAVSVPFSSQVRGLAVEAASGGTTLSGFIRVPRTGVYTFFLSPGPGSRMTVAGRSVLDPTARARTSESAGQVALRRGWHPLDIQVRGEEGAERLHLEMEGPERPRTNVPGAWLVHMDR